MNDTFEKKGYEFVESLLDENTTHLVSLYFENKIRRGIWTPTENLNKISPTKYHYYADPLSEAILLKATPFISQISKKKLIPTYSFCRIYQTGEELPIHYDRPSCEVSVTISVASIGKPSLIWMKNKTDEASSFELKPGDAVIYKGCEVDHWREPLVDNQLIVQFMLHYVDSEGPNLSFKYDKRPNLGYPR